MKKEIVLDNTCVNMIHASKKCLISIKEIIYKNCEKKDVLIKSNGDEIVENFFLLREDEKIYAEVENQEINGLIDIVYEIHVVDDDKLFDVLKEVASVSIRNANRIIGLKTEKRELIDAYDVVETDRANRKKLEEERQFSVLNKLFKH